MKKLSLVPRDPANAALAEKINTWLEAREDAQRLDADAFVVEISSADIASQVEITTGHDSEPIHYVRIEADTAGIPYGSSLVTEIRKLAEDLAKRFDLVVRTDAGPKPVAAFFDEGGF